MKKEEYHANQKLPFAFYLAASILFATLLISYIALAILTREELTRNERILTCVSSFLGLGLSIYGLYNAIKNKAIHSFFLAGMHLTLLSLSGFFHNLVPVFSDSSVSLGPWGIAAIVIFLLLTIAGLVGALLPRKFLLTRKILLVLSMTLLISIEAITFVSEIMEFVTRGFSNEEAALLGCLSAYTHLSPIIVLGIGIAFIFDVSLKNDNSNQLENKTIKKE